jgi:hypothetical protein
MRDAASVMLLALAVAAPRAAVADEPAPAGDPRDVFGLGRKDRERELATCAAPRALPCPWASGDAGEDADRGDGGDDPVRAPAAVVTRLSRARLDRIPLADADVDGAAALAVGGARDDVGAFYGGATGLENRWTLDGAPIDSPRTGALDSRVPLAFVDHVTVTTAGMSARTRAGTGAVIDAALVAGGASHRARAQAWLGGALPGRTPPVVPGELRLFDSRFEAPRAASAAAIVDGPLPALAGARTWYAAGVAPQLTSNPLVRRSYRLTDDDGDRAADREADGTYRRVALHDPRRRDSWAWSVPVLLRVGADRGAHHLALTGLATYAGDTRWLALAEDTAAGVDRRTLRLDGVASWRGRRGATRGWAQAAWHRSATTEAPHAGGGDAPAHGYAYVPPPLPGGELDAIDGAVRLGCADGGVDDVVPTIAQCPLPRGYYWTGGAGRLSDARNDRPSVSAEVAHRLGEHTLYAGVAADDGQLVRRDRYTGGSYRHQLGDGLYLDYQQVEIGAGPDFPDDCGDAGSCRVLAASERVYRTRHAAAWLVERWRPAATIDVEVGLRGEHAQLGTALVVRELLPRAGVAWDFLGGGRSRAFLGWGRFAAPLPTATGERLFAGPTVLQTAHFGDQQSSSVVNAPAGTVVADGAGATRVDEVVGGVDVGVVDLVRVAVTARHRRLGRALDDGPDGLGNPGAARGTTAARRDATEVTAALETTPTAIATVRAGYAWSRLRGNWPGPWDPIEGTTAGFSGLFADGGATNADGPLPGDQPHRFFAELAARGRAAGFALDGGVRAFVASGRPRSVRGAVGAPSFLLPRGAGGRLPAISQANLHLAARRGKVALTLDVFNLFDRRAVTAIDEVYADGARPIVGGDAADLMFARPAADDGAPLARNPRYGQPTRYQAPLFALLGVTVEL